MPTTRLSPWMYVCVCRDWTPSDPTTVSCGQNYVRGIRYDLKIFEEGECGEPYLYILTNIGFYCSGKVLGDDDFSSFFRNASVSLLCIIICFCCVAYGFS